MRVAIFARLRLFCVGFMRFLLDYASFSGRNTSIGGPFGLGMYSYARSVLVVHAFCSFAPAFWCFLAFFA